MKRLNTATILASTMLVLAPFLAQHALGAEQQGTEESSQEPEKMSVVGSRIKRVDFEGPQQIKVINREEILQGGFQSAAEVIRSLPQNSFGAAFDSTTNAQGANLRGIGSSNTLLLINGRRLPKDADTELADLSLIPVDAIEEIQVQLGGASAIYGSDALGGVVNIVTRRNFEGTSLSASYRGTKAGGGEQQSGSIVWGSAGKNSSSINILQFRTVERIKWSDRDWVDTNTQFGIGNPAAYQGVDGNFYAVSPCEVNDPENPDICGSDWYDDWDYFQGKVQQLTAMSQYTKDLNLDHRFKTDLVIMRREVQQSSTDNFLRGDRVPVSLLNNFDTPVAPNANEDGEVLALGFLSEAGPRISRNSVTTFQGGLGFEGALTDSLDYDTNFSYAESIAASETRNALIEEELFEAMEEGLYNPFAPVGEQGSLDSAKTNLYGENNYTSVNFDAGVSGELIENWAGMVEFALGYNFLRESAIVDSGDLVSPYGPDNEFRIFGYSGTQRAAKREVNSAYLETKIPLLSNLNLTTAVRFDEYSDVGNAFSPAAAFEYRPTRDLMVRASYTEGFKAPTLDDINSPLTKGFGFVRDYKNCGDPKDSDEGYCLRTQPLELFSGGNEDLKPETSSTISFGFVYNITESLSLNADYYQTKINDQIGSISADDVARYEREGKIPEGVSIDRDDNDELKSMTLPLLNLATTQSNGYDVALNYDMKTDWGRIDLSNNLAVKTVSKYERAPGQGFEDELKSQPKWRNSAAIGYGLNAHSVRLVNHHIDARRERADETGKVPSFNTFDLSYTYEIMRGSRVTIGGTNVTQTRMPIDTSSVSGLSKGISPSLYGIEGPTYFVRASVEM